MTLSFNVLINLSNSLFPAINLSVYSSVLVANNVAISVCIAIATNSCIVCVSSGGVSISSSVDNFSGAGISLLRSLTSTGGGVLSLYSLVSTGGVNSPSPVEESVGLPLALSCFTCVKLGWGVGVGVGLLPVIPVVVSGIGVLAESLDCLPLFNIASLVLLLSVISFSNFSNCILLFM